MDQSEIRDAEVDSSKAVRDGGQDQKVSNTTLECAVIVPNNDICCFHDVVQVPIAHIHPETPN